MLMDYSSINLIKVTNIFNANFWNKSMFNVQYIDWYGSSDYSRNLVLDKNLEMKNTII